jgi:peptidoglycan hydrolase CwlO-like protein
MNEKLQQLLQKLGSERDDFRSGLHLVGTEVREEWDKVENKWQNMQLRLRDAGLEWNLKAKEEIHDLGEDVDKLQHKIGGKVEDIRLEVMEELHELGEEIAGLYQKIRRHF